MATTWATEEASEKQLSYIQSLLQKREADVELLVMAGGSLTKAQASELIDRLSHCPWKQAAKPVELGYYVVDGQTVYVVVASKSGNGHRYAKVLQHSLRGKAKWVYAQGAMATLAGKTPVTLAEAAAFGHAHGWCMCCGAQLTDPKSVAAGIGPVCAKKVGA